MSSAFRPFLLELLAIPEARAARRGRAFAYLDETLERVLFANAAGEALFGVRQDESPAALLARQVRSGFRTLAGGARFPLLVRAHSARAALPVAALAIRFSTDGGAAILLAACKTEATANVDPRRLLATLGESDGVCAFDADGTPVAGDASGIGDGLPATVASFAAGNAAIGEAGGVRLFRIDVALIIAVPAASASLPAEEAPSADAAAAEDSVPAPRTDGLPAGDGAWKRLPLRSVWSVPSPAADIGASAAAPPHSSAEPLPEPQDETRQPVERESAVIVPDAPSEDFDAMDPAVSTDDEKPAEADADLVPSVAEPGLGTEPIAPSAAATDDAGQPTPAFVARLDAPPLRFVWQIDAEGRFRSLSPEFAEAVGPRAAAVVGRTFGDVAEAFGFDEAGAIRRLLERRDTWSGRTVLWPVEGTDRRVPIDLAALPTYSRDRAFDGFRGFGIVRSTDHEADAAAHGLALARPAVAPVEAPAPAEPEVLPPAAARKPLIRRFEADLPGVSFGRREAPPQSPAAEQDGAIRVERRRTSEATLSEAEEAAFREIGAKLGQGRSEAGTADTLRFETLLPDPAAPAAELVDPPTIDATLGSSPAEASGEPLAASDIEPTLAALPLPVLVQSRDRLVFANRAFAEWSGYADVERLNAAGGLEALFVESAGGPAEGAMRIRRADGETVESGVHMQRVAFAGHSSLLMTFERLPAAAPAPDADDLRREVGELRAVLDIATDGVVIVDPEGSIRAANGSAEALFGMPAAEFAGRPLAELFAHESRKAVLDYLEMLKDRGLAGIMNDGREVIGRVAQGGFVPLFITVGRVPDERGWCVVIRDMSHWKRIEEELVNAKRAAEAASLHKSRFLANISHELRTPLNAIIGFADVMASECFGPIGNERYVEYLGDIKRSGHHVLDLVNDLLDISKIEAGRMELSFEAVSLNEVLAEVVATMQPQANRERVIVRSNLPASVPPVVADRRTIRQIALNLLSNSVRFTPAGGQIIASTTYTAEGDVLLRVRDSGIGMTPSEIEIALTPFQQVHRPDEGRSTGTGLGLPLTKAMAEANRASFAIRSTPGEGTLVEIAFPSQRVLAD
ncbi:PAS domain-containing sensor histidine kinase [Aureimonas leprariae]|uniref:histidine kinase n=1 Tax=Plantimonas leprariae TaxID=2615207 RepID=A0A7V7PQF6_9HYPH|nr:PAS domain-containing sensor histidine kinase [Aureimonas leprariae]KAB0680409.1 PAS domain S-box protein [Aureimonas leprariae]